MLAKSGVTWLLAPMSGYQVVEEDAMAGVLSTKFVMGRLCMVEWLRFGH